MRLSALLAAAVLAVTTPAALAADFDLDVSGGSAGFFSTPPAGAFTDNYSFSALGMSQFILSATVSGATATGAQDVDFSAITLTGPSGPFSLVKDHDDPTEFWALDPVAILAGDYVLTLAGTNTVGRGSYAGTVVLAPIPEPSVVILMLAGLGGIGLMLRRRSRT